MNREIMITGSTGTVGQRLLSELNEISSISKIYLVVRDIKRAKKICQRLPLNFEKLVFIECNDLRIMSEQIKKKCRKVEVCVHLASYLTSLEAYDDVEKLLQSNIIFSSHLLEAIKELDIKLFINTGSFSEYFKPKSEANPAYLYSATKLAYKELLKYYSFRWNIRWIDVIPYTIYGGNDRRKKIIDFLLDGFDEQINASIELTSGEQILDFIHLFDVVNFYLNLILHHDQYDFSNGEKVFLGTGVGHSIKQIAEMIENKLNKKANICWGAKEYRPTDIMYAVANIEPLRKLFNWQPSISLSQGIDFLIEDSKVKQDEPV